MTYSTIYAFGDSLSDSGEAYLLTSSELGQALGIAPLPVDPPYFGEAYPSASGSGTITADVFSNGPVWVQDLAADLGLTATATGSIGPASLSLTPTVLLALLTSQVSSTLAQAYANELELVLGTSGPGGTIPLAQGAAGGTDFAIGGSVTGPTPDGAEAALTDLAAQFAYFQAAVPSPSPTALYTVWSGSNDLLNLVESVGSTTATLSSAELTDISTSVTNEVSFIDQLIGAGAKTLLVLNVPDLGVTPRLIGEGYAAAGTAAAAQYDSDLDAALGIPAGQGSIAIDGASVSLVNTFALIDGAVAHPAQYGLSDVTSPAYTGSFSSDGEAVAADPDSYLFFDEQHPTETGQSFVASDAAAVLAAACYLRGTRIATEGAEMAVEALLVGDRVMTVGGKAKPIRWIGRRSFAGRFLARHAGVMPIRFRAGSLGAGLPQRDLLISPEHAMLIDGALVPARCLVNGGTIRQERGMAQIDYFHIELAEHDAVLAEGAASETFLDDGSRGMFHNAADCAALDAGPGTGGAFCAPRVESGYHLEAIRQRLAEVAGHLACAA